MPSEVVTDPMTGMEIPSDDPPPDTTSAPAVGSKSLPTGRYWVTAFGDKQAILDAYFKDQSKNVHVETTENIDSTSDFPDGSFYIFNVSTPVSWPATQVGFPTIAPQNIHTLADTSSRPPVPPSTTKEVEDAIETAKKALASFVTVAEYGIAAFVGFKLFEMLHSKK